MMSENTVTMQTSAVTVSDRTLEQVTDSLRTKPRSLKQITRIPEKKVGNPVASSGSDNARRVSPSVTFVVDQITGKSYIQVVDRESGEILRQIPPEEARRLAEALEEMIGNVVDTVA